MAKPKALKVFRTPIGFHDAYVAAATKKAALEAWGSHRNLFALGEAELVTDEKLMRVPLASPGVVVKVSRGTTAEQLRALPKEKAPKKGTVVDKTSQTKSAPTRIAKPVPRPGRQALDRAEAKLAAANDAAAEARKVIEREIEKLTERRDALIATQSKELAIVQNKAVRARTDFENRMTRWRTDT